MALASPASTSATTTATTSSRRLLVPAADVLARNMRATEGAPFESASTGSGKHNLNMDNLPKGINDLSSPLFLMSLGKETEENAAKQKKKKARFQSASSLASSESAAKSNPINMIMSKLLKSNEKKSKEEEEEEMKEKVKKEEKEKAEKKKSTEKIVSILQKVSNILSKLPNPLIQLMAVLFVILLLNQFKQKWLTIIYTKIGIIFLLNIILIECVFYKRSYVLGMYKNEQYILSHPSEHKLDNLEMEMTKREQKIDNDLKELTKNEEKLDALRKEFSKEGNTINEDGQIIPNRKAAEMIVNGALGAGFDEETAAQVEQRRMKENVKKSREEWKQRAEMVGEDENEMKLNLRMLADHAAAAYNKRTREVKTNLDVSNPSSNHGNPLSNALGNKTSDKIHQLKKMVQQAAVVRALEEEARRNSRHSERSVPVGRGNGEFHGRASTSGKPDGRGSKDRDASTASRRRITFFGRGRRRETAPELDSRLTMSDAGGRRSNRRRR